MPDEVATPWISRARANGAYVIQSAESRPRAIETVPAPLGRSAATAQDKKLIEAVRRRTRCPECGAQAGGRCALEGDGDCPEGCITPEQW